MPLNFKSLIEETPFPPRIGEEMDKKRQQTIAHLSALRISNDLVAQICDVRPQTVTRWQETGKAPRLSRAQIALDRLGPVLEHMEDDLGLTDRAIRDFLTGEPTRTREERGLELDIRWTEEYEASCQAPLVTGIGAYRGVQPVQDRLMMRFRERYEVAAQIGQVATPESTYYF